MKYGLIGEKLGHSFSPEIHAALASYPYELCEVRREELEDFFRRRDFCGINVTIPYKETVIPLLDGVDPAAAEIGAVNTVINRGGRLYGYNTDLAGMTALFTRAGISLSGKKALILGTGGTSRTAAAAARLAGAREILKVSRSGREGALTYEDAVSLHADAQVLINTTPCGMFPDTDGKPIGLSAFPRLEGVIDVIYNPLRTRLVLEAKERGIPAAGGLYMLVTQAREAASLFLGEEIPQKKAEEACRALLKKKENLVLTGMPGAGKSTIGRLTARRLGLPFYDTDAIFVRRAGRSIPSYFEEFGEAAFRREEKEIVRELSLLSGAVIATGGGAVLDPENVRRLRQNGRIVLIDRKPSEIPNISGRPLARDRAMLEERYRERFALYHKTADEVIRAVPNLQKNIERLTEIAIRR
ncbi:MAG: hypothetical protein II771_04330 [Clostridia bacterium]|nr:hypothetical protein [Clostridia bacterium]